MYVRLHGLTKPVLLCTLKIPMFRLQDVANMWVVANIHQTEFSKEFNDCVVHAE